MVSSWYMDLFIKPERMFDKHGFYSISKKVSERRGAGWGVCSNQARSALEQEGRRHACSFLFLFQISHGTKLYSGMTRTNQKARTSTGGKA